MGIVIIFIVFAITVNAQCLKTWDVDGWFQNFPFWNSQFDSSKVIKLTQYKETIKIELNGNELIIRS